MWNMETITKTRIFREQFNLLSYRNVSIQLNIYWIIWDKVFKNRQSKICGRQLLKIWRNMVCLSRPYPFKLFKGCFPQILLGPLFHTLSHVVLAQSVAECSRFLVFEDVDCAMLFLIHFRARLLNIIFDPYRIFYVIYCSKW